MIDGLREELERHRAAQIVHEAQLTQAGLLRTSTHRLLPWSGEALFQLRKRVATAHAQHQQSPGVRASESGAATGSGDAVVTGATDAAPNPHEALAQQLRDKLKQVGDT